MKQIPLQVKNSTGFARWGYPPSICRARARACAHRLHSLAVTLGWPVVPLVVGLGLLCEEHLVEAAGTEQVSVRTQLCKRVSTPPAPRRDHSGKASDGQMLGLPDS